MFDYRQFLLSFWVLVTILLYIFSIPFSLDLLVRGILFRPHIDLLSGFRWLFSLDLPLFNSLYRSV